MNSGNYVAADFKDPPKDDIMELGYKIDHSLQCSHCGEYEGKCRCKSPLFFDVWSITFSDFTIEIYNEFDELDYVHTEGTIPKYPIEDVDLMLVSDLKNDKYHVTLMFYNGAYYLDTNNH
jgi:hypothetical protein